MYYIFFFQILYHAVVFVMGYLVAHSLAYIHYINSVNFFVLFTSLIHVFFFFFLIKYIRLPKRKSLNK
ncbi:hypothetical protein BDC45DRAFT_493857 [Circinella umbellata]|nr:hypothetical protein BDC45DRAFT_493857 [Circinella umbellata]